MRLREVVDLEAQLALDEGRDEESLRERDRALFLEHKLPPAPADALLTGWLAALRERFGAPRLGERVAMATRVLGYVLALGGIASGWGVAEVLLHYEQGAAPVNVGHYLLVLVLGQLATLVLLGLGLLLRRIQPELPVLGDLARLLRYLARRLEARLADAGSRIELETERAAYHRIRTRLGLYERLERYLLLSHTQLFAVAFNLGALASCLRLILLSDLAFSWSTSVASLGAGEVHRLCAVLSAPFAWLVPDAVPSTELIEHTQYFRLEGRFAGAAPGTRGDPALAGGWWRFLIACTVTYGLLPRLAAFAVFRGRLRAAERDVPLDTPAVQRVLARLTTPALSMGAERVLPQAAEPAHEVQPIAERPSQVTALVLYRDIPTDVRAIRRALAAATGLEVASVHRAGGLAVRDDEALCKELGRTGTPVTLVAEAWEAPDKSLRGLLAALREALGARIALRVALIGEASARGFEAATVEDVRVYRDRLTLLEDPYLSVEALPATAQADIEEEVHG